MCLNFSRKTYFDASLLKFETKINKTSIIITVLCVFVLSFVLCYFIVADWNDPFFWQQCLKVKMFVDPYPMLFNLLIYRPYR